MDENKEKFISATAENYDNFLDLYEALRDKAINERDSMTNKEAERAARTFLLIQAIDSVNDFKFNDILKSESLFDDITDKW